MNDNEREMLAHAWEEFPQAIKAERPFCWVYAAIIWTMDKLAALLERDMK